METRRSAGVLVAVAALSCAGSQKKTDPHEAFGARPDGSRGEVGQPVPTGDAVSTHANVTPEHFARSFKRPLECEQAARSAQRAAPDKAWQYLRACVGRGGFTLLTVVLDHWMNDLRTRPDAPVLLADIIAARGGHVRTDLQTVQQKRLPVFDLGSALAQPGTYKGRYVLFAAKVGSVKTAKGRTEVALAEMAVGAEAVDVVRGLKSVHSSAASGEASYKTTRYGSGSVKGSYEGSSSSANVETTFQESFSETGQEIVAKLTKPDPFLTLDRQFIFLAKFDGARETDLSSDDDTTSEEPAKVALVSIVSYHDMNTAYTW